MSHLLVVSGPARSGKDTVISLSCDRLRGEYGLDARVMSVADPIKDVTVRRPRSSRPRGLSIVSTIA